MAGVVGKLVGGMLLALPTTSLPVAPWAVPDSVHGAMAVMTLATCVVTPLVLGPILRR